MQKIMFDDRYGLTSLALEGYKIKTRRMIPKRTWKKIGIFQNGNTHLKGKELIEAYFANNPQDLPYRVGEIVAVAQSYKSALGDIYCERDFMPLGMEKGWSNKMFVKPELMLRQIMMVDYKVERLQDISDEDCLKEGIKKMFVSRNQYEYSFFDRRYACWMDFPTQREAFASLIDKVSGKGTWESNPFVLAYDFELVK